MFYFIILKKIKFSAYQIPSIVLFLTLLIGSFSLPYHWDDTFYNSYFLKEYLKQENFNYLTHFGYYSAFPIYGSALNIIFYSLFNYYGTGLISIVFLSLFLLYVNYFLSKLLIKDSLKNIGILIFIGSYAIIEYGGTAKEDIIVNFLIFLSFYFLIFKDRLFGLNHYYSSFIFYSFSLGFKYTALNFLPIFYLYFLYKIFHDAEYKNKILQIHINGFFIALSINFPWLLRNFIEIGNPIYPLLSGHLPFEEKIIFTEIKKIYLNEQINGHIHNKFNNIFSFINFIEYTNKSIFVGTLFFPLILFKSKFKIFVNLEKEIILISIFLIIWMFFFLNWEMRHFVLIYFFSITSTLILINKIKLNKFHNKYLKLKNLLYILLVIILFFNGLEKVVKKYGKQFLCSIGENPIECLMAKNQYLRTVDFINNNIPKNERIATNALPYLYLNNEFIYIQPWADYTEIDLDNPEYIIDFLRNNKVNFLSWSFFDQHNAYDEKKGANLKKYFYKINDNIKKLESDKKLMVIFKDKNTKLYIINHQ